MQMITCPQCRGAGQIPCNLPFKTTQHPLLCPQCKGDETVRLPCPLCEGKGLIPYT